MFPLKIHSSHIFLQKTLQTLMRWAGVLAEEHTA